METDLPPSVVRDSPVTPAGTGGTEVSVAVVPDPKKSLMDLKELFDAGIITQADFDSKKAELLARLKEAVKAELAAKRSWVLKRRARIEQLQQQRAVQIDTPSGILARKLRSVELPDRLNHRAAPPRVRRGGGARRAGGGGQAQLLRYPA
mgnify:CR=1 FL=1